MTKIRLLLADDHEMVRSGLKLLIDSQPDMETVGEAGDGREAVRLAQELKPDVVVLDVSMPRMNGMMAAEQIGESCPGVRVLTLTRHTDEGFLQQLLRAGVSGYVLKQSAPAELINAVRAVSGGGNYLDPAVAGKVLSGFAHQRAKAGVEARRDLSEREAEVLRLIARGYSNKEVAAQLDISVKTVEVHKSNAMKKLGIHSRIQILRYAMLQGWLQDL